MQIRSCLTVLVTVLIADVLVALQTFFCQVKRNWEKKKKRSCVLLAVGKSSGQSSWVGLLLLSRLLFGKARYHLS